MSTSAPVSSALGARPLRADALRNRERVLTAARELFAESGRAVQMEDLARRAGVGIGTVYRHFPTKEALVEALVDRLWVEIVDHLHAECGPEVEPYEAMRRALLNAGETQERDRLFCDCIEEMTGRPKTECPAFAGVHEHMDALIARGRADGVLRADLTVDRMQGVFCGLAAVVRSGLDWRPYVEIVLAGLRA